MSGSSNKSLAVAALAGAVAIGSVAVAAYLRYKDDEDSEWMSKLQLFFTEDADTRQALILCDKLNRALSEVEKNVDDIHVIKSNISTPSSSSSSSSDHFVRLKKLLAEASSDLDFLFGELDQIRGDGFIRKKRKQIADRINSLSSRVDDAMALVSAIEFQSKNAR